MIYTFIITSVRNEIRCVKWQRRELTREKLLPGEFCRRRDLQVKWGICVINAQIILRWISGIGIGTRYTCFPTVQYDAIVSHVIVNEESKFLCFILAFTRVQTLL